MTSDNISVNSDGVHVILDDGSEIVFASDKTQVKYNIDYSYNAKETQSIKIIISDNTPIAAGGVLGLVFAGVLIISFIGLIIWFVYKVLGEEGIRAMNGLLGIGSDSLREFSDGVHNAGDAAKDMANIKLDNLQGDITLLQSAFQGLQKQVGDKILPSVRKGVQALTKALGELSENVSIDRIAESIGNITSVVFDEILNAIKNLPSIIDKVANAFKWLSENFKYLMELIKMGIQNN